MAPPAQSTKIRLLKLLQDPLRIQPNTSVSLSELAQTLGVSRERVRQIYHRLAVEYVLPPVKKRRPGIGEVKQSMSTNVGDMVRKLRTPSPQTLALETEVRKYSEQDISVPEIARKIGRPAPTIYTVLHRLHIPFNSAKDTGRRLRNPEILALEAEVRSYSEQGLTAPEIAKRTGRHETTIQRIHRRLHIPLQPRRKSPQTLALEAEVRSYSEQGLTAPEIAKRTGRPGRTIYGVLQRLRIPRNLMGAAVHSGKSPETRALEAEVRVYIEQDMTVAEIAKRTGRPVQTIYHIFRRFGIPFTRALRRKSPETRALEAEVRSYSEQGLTAPEIAGKIGRPRTTIYSILSRLGIPFKGVKVIGRRNPKTLAFEAEVKWYYFSLGMSSQEIASITRRDMKTVYAALHRLGVSLRNQSHGSG